MVKQMVEQQTKKDKKIVCPECGSEKVFEDRKTGELHCSACGFVIEEDSIDFGQEWREFDYTQVSKRRRVGGPTTYTKHDLGLSTRIGKTGDIYKLSSKDRRKFFRLTKWQTRISTAIERNLKFALAELRRVASYLDLPGIVEEDAAKTYREAAEKGLVRGRSMESVVAGTIYSACRKNKIPRTLDEIAQAFPLSKKEAGKTYRFICRQLNIRILPTDPLDYVNRFSNELTLTPKTQAKAVEIIKLAQKRELTSGKGPTGISAAALYVAALLCTEKRTQREVADVAGVTEVTIRNRYKELIDKLELSKQVVEPEEEK